MGYFNELFRWDPADLPIVLVPAPAPPPAPPPVVAPLLPVRATVQIDQAGGNDGPTQRSELGQAVEALWRVAEEMVSTQAITGDASDRNGLSTGHWTYTPTAPS